jgi:hypothetical protein
MSPVAGFESCVRLREALGSCFGRDLIVDAIQPTQDAFGWRLASKPRLLFSVSTLAGELPLRTFDLQVSVSDGTLKNGEILFGPESPILSIEDVCDVVARYRSQTDA